MPRIFDTLKAEFDEFLKNSKVWILTQNPEFFKTLFTHPNAIIGIAEGDSWFDYDFTSKFIEKTGHDLICHLTKDHKLNILRLSVAGDTLENMVDENHIVHLKHAMKLIRPKFFLFSGGGNDMAGQYGVHLKEFLNESGLDSEKAKEVIHVKFRKYYQSMIHKVQSVHSDILIFIHGYCYPIPDGRGVKHPEIAHDLAGPWLKCPMDKLGYSEELRQNVIIDLIDEFNIMLETVAKSNHHVHYIDLRPLLPILPDPAYKKFWANELHPTSVGFKIIADKFEEVMTRNIN